MRKSFLKIIGFFGLFFLLRGNVVSWTSMLSGSMSPTLKATLYSQDLVLIDKLSYKFTKPRRGDIVHIFGKNKEGPKEFIFKRITGLPGENLEIRNNQVLINDKPLTDPIEFSMVKYINEGWASPGVVLNIASDSYFVMGDNSADSWDSRYWGAVKSEEILGRAAMIIWPPKRFGRIFPKD